MKKLLNFDDWVNYVFDHPVTDPAWWNDEYLEPVEISDADKFTYCLRLFDSPKASLERFSDDQIRQGFIYLISGYGYVGFPDVDQGTLPLEDRRKLIRSIHTLFEKFLAPRCPGLEENPISYLVCNWWEMYSGGPSVVNSLLKSPELRRAYEELQRSLDRGESADCYLEISQVYLQLLVDILKIENYFCQVSAIEAIGMSYPQEASRIIDDFLKRPKTIPQSREFALKWKGVLQNKEM